MNLEEKIKHLPNQPGVYLMKNAAGEIIYVGKAKILKNRVRQYFMNLEGHTPKVLAMVSNIADFEYIITDTETEAFVLECNLIKKYRPHYNILLKDDKAYPYIKVSMEKAYPRIELARRTDDSGARFFGPYISSGTVNHTIEMVYRIFKVAHCKKKFPRDIGKERPCLYASMGQCMAPCQNSVSQAEYKAVFEEVCEFLSGHHGALLRRLERDMKAASEKMEYERAAAFRDRLTAIRNLEEKQKVSSDASQSLDVIVPAVGERDTVVTVLSIRDGKVLENENFFLEKVGNVDEKTILDGFLKQYYLDAPSPPDEVVIPFETEETEFLSTYLSQIKGRKVSVRVPQRGRYMDLLKMAEKNARHSLKSRAPGLAERKELRVLEEVQKTLGLSALPRRIESYDISHISGADSVGAAVVFTDGKPDRKNYIRMKMKNADGNNDFLSMKELLFRRFQHRIDHPEQALFAPLPDLMLMDGGAAQMTAAQEVLRHFHLSIPVFGMVKDDRHRTRGLVNSDGEISLPPFGTVFLFLTRVQDEVHKTAISYHRKKRQERMKQSELLEIAGIGPQKAKNLMTHFKSIQKIKRAERGELLNVSGIGEKDAEAIWRHFHPYGE